MNELTVTRRGMVGISVALATLPGPVLARSGDDAMRFHSLLERLAAADMRALPLSDDRIDPPFVDPLTDRFVADARAETEAQSHALATISRDALAFADRLAFDVVRYRLDQERARVDQGVALTALRAPLDPSFGLHIEFPDLFAGARYRNVADYEIGLKRLAGFAGYLDSTIMRLREGLAAGQVQPRIIVRNVLAQVDAMLALPIERSPFYAPLATLPDGMPGAERARLTAAYVAAIGGPVYAGYRAWQVYLRDTYLAQAPEGPGRWAMKGGDALYASEIMRHTTTKLPADQIHALGLSEVARIRDAMEKARVSAGLRAISVPSSTIFAPILASIARHRKSCWAGSARSKRGSGNPSPSSSRGGPTRRSGCSRWLRSASRGVPAIIAPGHPTGKRRACSISTWRCSIRGRSPRSRL
jgi:uncharacterized protein (DUF885 family)